jgi:hypothetical protein
VNPGDQVKFSRPLGTDEAALRFDLMEIRGDRVLIRLRCDWRIRPTEVVAITEIESVGCSDAD